jgi:dipeptidyl aminopeptidase/acylaminoacyl peptidase
MTWKTRARAGTILLAAAALWVAGCADMEGGASPGAGAGQAAAALDYFDSGDFKFPPIRGDEGLVRGPLSIDQVLDLAPAGNSPFWHPATGRITYSAGGGLWTVDPAGGPPSRINVELGDSGFFLTPQHPAYSPGGEWLSWISNRSGTPELWLRSESGGREIQLTDLGSNEINAYAWSPDGSRIAFSGNRHGSFDVWMVSVPDGRVHRVTSDPLYEVYPTWSADGSEILYVRLDEAWVDHDVIAIRPDGSDARLVAQDTDFFDYGYSRTFGFPLVSPTGDRVVIRSHRSGWINYWMVPMEGGEPRPLFAQEADQSDGAWSPDGAWFAFTSNHNGTHDLRLVSADGGEARILVEPEAGMASSPRWSPDGTRIVYTLQTPTRPTGIHVVSVEDGESRVVLEPRAEPEHLAHLVEPEKIEYPSTDGLSIPAYLYRPADAGGGDRHPAILWIHGGPTSQWHDSFHADVQFFVQQGYVVLMPNIRGSSGYSKAFEQLNEQCWGHCDLEDVVAGVEYLETLPYVAQDHMGIYGSSYGGIMSMAAAAFAPGVFQAAIPHGGYGDWIEFYHGKNELRHIKLLEHDLGPFEEYEEVWRRSSSIFHVEDITTPMLLVHGYGHYPVYRQTYDFAQALQRHQKTFRYNVYPGENYYVSSRENRRQLWLDMLRFLDQQLGGGPAQPGRISQ